MGKDAKYNGENRGIENEEKKKRKREIRFRVKHVCSHIIIH